MQALEVKLKKTMSMLELGPEEGLVDLTKMSTKAREFGRWLEKSTEEEWGEMRVIRARLDKLESQKKALLESQEQGHGSSRVFRMRNHMRKRDPLSQSVNPKS